MFVKRQDCHFSLTIFKWKIIFERTREKSQQN
jgi:hypothetical protein